MRAGKHQFCAIRSVNSHVSTKPRAESTVRALMKQNSSKALQNTKTAIPWSKSEPISPLRHTVHTAACVTLTKIGLILSPLHLSYRLGTIPLSLFLFLYNE